MKKINFALILVCFWLSMVLSGCSRSKETLYFDLKSADDMYAQAMGEHTDGPLKEDLSKCLQVVV